MAKVKTLYNKTIGAIDPRYYLIINHAVLLLTAVILFDLRRSWEQIVLAIVVAVITELLLSKITLKQKKFDPKDRVISAVALALGALLLVRSPYWWFYGFIACIGVISKYIVLNKEGRHIYNPTNVAIVFAIIVLPEFLHVRPDSFTTHIFSLLCILFWGGLAIIRANRWRITLGYFLGIFLIGTLATILTGYPFLLIIGPELNATIILFAFLMITDPQTTPRNVKLQWIFGFSIAAINLFLRYEQLYYTQFISLFIVLSFSVLFFSPNGFLARRLGIGAPSGS
jgi:Na+-translocating ferredoxin:NAD+ oxidoreductase RnfD subunit